MHARTRDRNIAARLPLTESEDTERAAVDASNAECLSDCSDDAVSDGELALNTESDDDNDDDGESTLSPAHGGRRAGAGQHHGTRHSRFIDRMPHVARTLDPLSDPYRVIVYSSSRSETGRRRRKQSWYMGKEPSEAEQKVFKAVQKHTVTSFNPHERAHPINAFEQVVSCKHCGAWRAPHTTARKCCQDGGLVLKSYQLGDELLDLAAGVACPR